MILKAHVAKSTQKEKSTIVSHGNFNYVLQRETMSRTRKERFCWKI